MRRGLIGITVLVVMTGCGGPSLATGYVWRDSNSANLLMLHQHGTRVTGTLYETEKPEEQDVPVAGTTDVSGDRHGDAMTLTLEGSTNPPATVRITNGGRALLLTYVDDGLNRLATYRAVEGGTPQYEDLVQRLG